MKKSLLILTLAIAGCASPAASYVQADADTWAVFDPFIDRWIDSDASITTQGTKDAMHQLNVARRARVSHALASINSGAK